MKIFALRFGISFVAVGFALSGCGVYRDYAPPTDPPNLKQDDFTQVDDARYQAAAPVTAWWEKFSDADLNQLMQEGVANNLDIQIALANLIEARSLTRHTSLDKFPTIQAFFDYRRQKLTEEGVTFALSDPTFNGFESGFDLNWELNLFGRVTHRIDFAKALDQARLADVQSAYVSVSAEIARAYIDLRGAQLRLDIARRNAKNQDKTYELTKTLLKGGSASSLDVARAKTQLDLTRATIPPLETEESSAIYRLSILTSRVPRDLEDRLSQRKSLPSLPPSVAVGSPQDLLRRRPDIRSAERELAARTAQYNLAVADLFPSVNLTGAINFSATALSNFKVDSGIEYSAGPSIRWAAFDLGRVFSRIDQNDAAAFRALKTYEKTVLTALGEVQSALVAFDREDQRLRTLRDAAQSSATAAKLASQRFEAGIDGFLDVLDAERTLLESEDSQAVSEIRTAQNLIEIYRSLGGGWDMIASKKDLPTHHDLPEKNDGKPGGHHLNAAPGQWKGLKVNLGE